MYVVIMVNGRTAWKGDVQQAHTVTIGSAATADIRLESGAVAANHADLSLELKGGWLCAHAPVIFDGQPVIGWAQLGDLVQLTIASFSIIVYFSTNTSVAARHARSAAPSAATPTSRPAPASAPPHRTGLTAIFPAVSRAEIRRIARAVPRRGLWARFWSRREPAARAPEAFRPAQASKPGGGFFKKRKAKTETAAAAKSAAADLPPSAAAVGSTAPVGVAPVIAAGSAPLPAAEAVAGLAGLFALPSAEATRPSASSAALLQHRRLGLTIKSWLMILVSGAVGMVTFATREVPRVNAGRGLAIQLIPSAAGVRPADHKPRKAEALVPAKVKAAADALISGDISSALTLYQKLAESDAAFVPFVQALKRRLSANCNDPAGRRDPC